jgi:hypothetical protein
MGEAWQVSQIVGRGNCIFAEKARGVHDHQAREIAVFIADCQI